MRRSLPTGSRVTRRPDVPGLRGRLRPLRRPLRRRARRRVARAPQASSPGCASSTSAAAPGALAAQAARIVGPANVAAVDPSEPFVEALPRANPGRRRPRGGRRVAALRRRKLRRRPRAARRQLPERRAARAWPRWRASRSPAASWPPASGTTRAGCGCCGRSGMPSPRVDPDGADTRRGPLHALREPGGARGALVRSRRSTTSPSRALDVEASYDDFDDLWTPFLAGIGPAGAYTRRSIPPDAQEALRERAAHHARQSGRAVHAHPALRDRGVHGVADARGRRRSRPPRRGRRRAR